jgi:O-phosphoseryl-tRNA(Cys) synthetase
VQNQVVATKGIAMTQARKVFEALMRTKGYDNFETKNGRYIVPSLQTRWIYFWTGWEMCEVNK